MQEMVEPDRTIMIVSIIALVIIWGSVAYHKFVQDGGPPVGARLATLGTTEAGDLDSTGDSQMVAPADAGLQKSGGSKKRKKKRR
jgi:hypothetical protein